MAREQLLNEEIKEKWKPVLEHENFAEITDRYRKSVTNIVLENQVAFLKDRGLIRESEDPTNVTNDTDGNIQNWNPVLISMIRRSTPNLLAFDVAGVQPMSGPTGLIFAMRTRYNNPKGAEALFGEPDSAFSGNNSTHNPNGTINDGVYTSNSISTDSSGDATVDVVNDLGADAGFKFGPHDVVTASEGTVSFSQGGSTVEVSGATASSTITVTVREYIRGEALATRLAEILGGDNTDSGAWNEMAFSIEKTEVSAKSRALKATYSVEIAQDLRAIHGVDAEAELSNILSTELLAEQNRELIRLVNYCAKLGATNLPAGGGVVDLDPTSGPFADDTRWFIERWKRLLFQLEVECNQIAKDTRRGRGNFIMCSSDVASALSMAGLLDYAPAIQSNLNVDDTGNLFAGILNGRIRVYVDPFAPLNYVTIGFRGANQFDAGIYWAPYVPLEMYKAQGEDNFQPRIGFKTRYGIVANPFATIEDPLSGASVNTKPGNGLGKNENMYFRKFAVENLY